MFTINSEYCIHDLHRDIVSSVDIATPPEGAPPDSVLHARSFDLRGVRYSVDVSGALCFQVELTGEWWRVTLYARLEEVLLARMQFLDLRSKLPIFTPSRTQFADYGTALLPAQGGASSSGQASNDISILDLYPSGSVQLAVDSWVQEYQEGRRVEGSRHSKKLVCPVPGCIKKPRRPHALKEHVYFHLKVKPHLCGLCSKGFETVANQKRHEKTCSDASRPERAQEP
ncbi:hypothetical protein FRC12_019606 [Ceratobasidium sp. 428]|nr:hypothetical protein FRC12_019606 [Ceratobasidium sp. 428]